MPPPIDPFLYFAGTWIDLNDSLRDRLFQTLEPDAATQRSAWESLFEENNRLILALALDLVIQEQATSRMGDRITLQRDYMRKAAIALLQIDGIDGQNHWNGQPIPDASHIVALRILSKVATPEDGLLVASIRPDHTMTTDWESAWVAAAAAVLRETPSGQSSPLIEQLLWLSRNSNLAERVRRELVLAIGASQDVSAECALHEIYRTTNGSDRIEAIAQLAIRNALNENELEFIQTILEGDILSGVILERKSILLAALASWERERGF
ncbi:MAG: hypothetical protein B0A82_04140 [Alkalinema sp. CACIAM 70d]|nr:MAG: hypothetical protein B0A82_04140 [Alkalinema sp. CACIAM 70d]